MFNIGQQRRGNYLLLIYFGFDRCIRFYITYRVICELQILFIPQKGAAPLSKVFFLTLAARMLMMAHCKVHTRNPEN
jgi:hypothetical protein